MGTTTAQKKLFFNLKKLKNQIAPGQEGDLRDSQVNEISKRLDVDSQEVVNMNRRMMGQEKSLNSPIKAGDTDEWQDWLVDDSQNQEQIYADREELEKRSKLLTSAMEKLDPREQYIIQKRRLSDNVATLEELGSEFGISRERVRQVEVKAFEKLQKSIQSQMIEAST